VETGPSGVTSTGIVLAEPGFCGIRLTGSELAGAEVGGAKLAVLGPGGAGFAGGAGARFAVLGVGDACGGADWAGGGGSVFKI
jgi:hypothetical protein